MQLRFLLYLKGNLGKNAHLMYFLKNLGNGSWEAVHLKNSEMSKH